MIRALISDKEELRSLSFGDVSTDPPPSFACVCIIAGLIKPLEPSAVVLKPRGTPSESPSVLNREIPSLRVMRLPGKPNLEIITEEILQKKKNNTHTYIRNVVSLPNGNG